MAVKLMMVVMMVVVSGGHLRGGKTIVFCSKTIEIYDVIFSKQ